MMHRPKGFTLIELMVAMSVGMVVLLAAVGLLRSAGEGYGRNTDGISAEREARAVLSQAGEDLAKAVRKRLLVEEKDNAGWRSDRLGFLCLQPADAQAEDERIGDLCAVVYYLSDITMGGRSVRCLMRGFRGSSETFLAVGKKDVSSLYQPDPLDEPVAFGVVAFEVEPLIRRTGGRFEKWRAPADESTEVTEWPTSVRLTMVVARRELTGKLQNAADWQSHPLLGTPDKVAESKQLETYEALQSFGHED
ncbi:MAG: type II secretion system GspH family protein [Akkermansiaceae bacterium]|jgi:prepilin-type N-terminal cleavage/methylation domain-containing protein|nr:type II secretion system GspH family protein [Akkermansiaceae bacterium]